MDDDVLKEKFNQVWTDLVHTNLNKVDRPQGYVLGGQPGAGKSGLLKQIENELQKNIMIINGDDFRRYHPDFDKIQARYGQEAPQHTAEFSGQMTKMAIEKAVNEGYNVAIEGTFRTAETPVKTLEHLHKNGYEPHVAIMTCPKDVSWEGTLDRFFKMEEAGLPPRYVDKKHHDLVVDNLGKNADTVLESGLAKTFKVYNREGLIFDKNKTNEKPSIAINKELNKNEPQKQAQKTRTKNNGLEL